MNRGAILGIIVVIVISIFVVYYTVLQENEGGTGKPPGTIVPSPRLVKATLPAAEDKLVFDASEFESITGALQVIEEEGCLGNRCLFIKDMVLGKPPRLTAYAKYKFTLRKAGTFKLWVRHWWQDECANSLYITFDDGPQNLYGEDGTINRWRWSAMKVMIDLEEGEHTMVITPREDGLKFDTILLTTDVDFYPVGLIKATVSKAAAK